MNRDNSRRISAIALPAALVCAFSASSQAGEWSANASMTSNYIGEGLPRQKMKLPFRAVSITLEIVVFILELGLPM
mgnify:CR=1 FL=1